MVAFCMDMLRLYWLYGSHEANDSESLLPRQTGNLWLQPHLVCPISFWSTFRHWISRQSLIDDYHSQVVASFVSKVRDFSPLLERCSFFTSCFLRLEVKFIKIGGKITCLENGLPSALSLILAALSDSDSESSAAETSILFRFCPASG